jgi:Macrocin-O-methyltransferase (TylF)
MLPTILRPGHRSASGDRATALYLDLMKRCLRNGIYRDAEDTTLGRSMLDEPQPWRTASPAKLRGPRHTMMSLKRLDNVQFCVEDVLTRAVPGDLIETGVWRGGGTILMRAILAVYDVTDRRVWVADSFEGVPPPSAAYPQDEGLDYHLIPELAVSVEQVMSNFDRYGLLDEQVRFLKGWFRDTLPTAEIETLSVLRLDGDLYESTMDALVHLYPKLSVGGYVIVDDYGAILACRRAVHDYRDAQGITDKILPVDWSCSYWQRTV